ncbi:outer membrane protease [Devosia sp. UYZn731]|uniref:omptin family outer membrane protease n=1 Tax=Devosia sp. UYZn731 TaxID=3156345 RepID=UPI00339ADFCC
MLRSSWRCGAGLALMLGCAPALAQDISNDTLDQRVVFSASIGAMNLRANEFVFDGNHTLSQLTWQSTAPVLRSGADVQLSNGFTLKAEGALALSGSSYMQDYDWRDYDGAGPFVPGDGPDDWTDRSQHPDTQLDYFASGSAALGYDLVRGETGSINLNGGLQYSDVQWTASGGSALYSTGGFRNNSFNIPAGPVVTYRQQLPSVFAGVDGQMDSGRLHLGGMLRAGVTVFGRSADEHWQRDLRFSDALYIGPTLAIGANAAFDLGPTSQLFVAARYNQVFTTKATSDVRDTSTGAVLFYGSNSGGLDLRTIDVTAGLKASF